jgi:hypothetical protein
MPDPVLGYRTFTDGSTRLVYSGGRGQYVFDDDGTGSMASTSCR